MNIKIIQLESLLNNYNWDTIETNLKQMQSLSNMAVNNIKSQSEIQTNISNTNTTLHRQRESTSFDQNVALTIEQAKQDFLEFFQLEEEKFNNTLEKVYSIKEAATSTNYFQMHKIN